MDYTDINCQKRLIKTFINSVFVYDDKIVLTFNYSGDDRIVTLKEIDGGLQHGVRMPHLMWGQTCATIKHKSPKPLRNQGFFAVLRANFKR